MSDKKILGRDALLSAKRKTVVVDIPELEGSVILRELSIGQAQKIESDVSKQLALMIVDEEGNLLFTSPEDIEKLSELSATVTMRLLTAAAKLNGIGQAAVDEAVKNLIASPNDVSASA